jgi:hypothetical protein
VHDPDVVPVWRLRERAVVQNRRPCARGAGDGPRLRQPGVLRVVSSALRRSLGARATCKEGRDRHAPRPNSLASRALELSLSASKPGTRRGPSPAPARNAFGSERRWFARPLRRAMRLGSLHFEQAPWSLPRGAGQTQRLKIEMYTTAAIRVALHDAAVARPSSCKTEGLEAGGGERLRRDVRGVPTRTCTSARWRDSTGQLAAP